MPGPRQQLASGQEADHDTINSRDRTQKVREGATENIFGLQELRQEGECLGLQQAGSALALAEHGATVMPAHGVGAYIHISVQSPMCSHLSEGCGNTSGLGFCL